MTYKRPATANDWQRWKASDQSHTMTIERVTIEGLIQGKRAKMDITQLFIGMQAELKALKEGKNDISG